MFRTFTTCAGISVGIILCFLSVQEFVFDRDPFPLLCTLSVVLIASVCEVIPRQRIGLSASRFERALALPSLGELRKLDAAHSMDRNTARRLSGGDGVGV